MKYGNIWKRGNLDTHEEIFDVIYTGTRFVAVGSFARAYRSTNGKTWSKQTIAGLNSTKDALFGLGYDRASDMMVAVGRDKLILSSEDQGATWTIRKSKIGGSGDLYKVAFGNNMFLAISEEGQIWKSNDGIDWTQSASLGVGSRHLTFGNGWFLAATVPGKIYRSTNGTSWTSAYLGGNIKAVHYGNSKWVAVGGKIWTSTNNGASWTTQVTLSEYGIDLKLYCVTSAPGPSFITGGDGGLLLNSADGITWREEDSKTKRMILGMTYSPGESLVVAVGTGAPRNPMALMAYSTHYSAEGGTPGPILEPPSGNTIRITSPNGGENLTGGTLFNIKWQSSTTFDKVDIEYYNGSKWEVIKNGAQDNGSYSWSVPNISTTEAKIWIKGWSSGRNPVDFSNDTFTISPSASITVTSPNGGEVLVKGSTENITWNTSGEVGSVNVSYSTNSGLNWTTIASSTPNHGTLAWKVPDIISDNCLVKVSDASNSRVSDPSNNEFSIGGLAKIVMDKTRLNFDYVKNSAFSGHQTLFISNRGDGTLNWTAEANAKWINLNPGSGTSGVSVTVSIDPTGLAAGSYRGTITVCDPGAINSPQTADVYLTVKDGFQDQLPFGEFATPKDGTTGVSGSIGVTGWALDDTGVESVKIYREVNGGLSYIGDAAFVEGARPDVEQAYPGYPNNSQAGWGYTLLTNLLPDGKLVLKAIARDTTGNQVELGTKTIFVDNANAMKPFGAIDTPTQGGEASGSKFRNSGWALTPMPNKIPENGTTIKVFIDGQPVGKANYNNYRKDIAQLFPGYANSNGAWAYFDLDTTVYSSGVHTISWSVTDNAGNSAGIGSRYFTIRNTREE